MVSEAFRETQAIRFEGNGYAQEWVDEAERRGLLNLRRTPEALGQLVTPQSRAAQRVAPVLGAAGRVD